MSEENLKKLINVIPINKDSTNLIFISKVAMSSADGRKLADQLAKKHKSDFGAIVFINGSPHEMVKLVSAKDLEKQ